MAVPVYDSTTHCTNKKTVLYQMVHSREQLKKQLYRDAGWSHTEFSKNKSIEVLKNDYWILNLHMLVTFSANATEIHQTEVILQFVKVCNNCEYEMLYSKIQNEAKVHHILCEITEMQTTT